MHVLLFTLRHQCIGTNTPSLHCCNEQAHSDSILVKNLKACNLFRLYDGNAALNEMKDIANLEKVLRDHELIRHNMVVFTDGQKALQVLPNLINQIPEAKLNLAIFYLRNDQVSNAVDLLEGLEPSNPQEYILKAITSTLGSEFVDDMHRDSVLDEAKSYFESVGTSPSETDTIPGRQCMAQYYFLRNKFEDVNIYLGSIQNFMSKIEICCFCCYNTKNTAFFVDLNYVICYLHQTTTMSSTGTMDIRLLQ
jgi:intraflagellar transport protein 56